HYHFYYAWELSLPLVPWMILPYVSVYLMPAVVLWFSSVDEIDVARRSLTAQILISSAFFLAFPAQLGFVRTEVPGFWESWYKVLFMVDYPHNLLPSLHVAFGLAWVLALRSHTGRRMEMALWSW